MISYGPRRVPMARVTCELQFLVVIVTKTRGANGRRGLLGLASQLLHDGALYDVQICSGVIADRYPPYAARAGR